MPLSKSPTLKEEPDSSSLESSSEMLVPVLGRPASDSLSSRHHLLQVLQESGAGQFRPSVLCSTALLLDAKDSRSSTINRKDKGHNRQIPSQNDGINQSRKPFPNIPSHNPVQFEGQSCLCVNGQCCWPGCDKLIEGQQDFSSHLNRDHSPNDRTIAQCRLQRDLVRHMESQLSQEKQRLSAMQLHLQLFHHLASHAGASASCCRPLALNMPLWEEPDGRAGRAREGLAPHKHGHMPRPQLMPDLISSVEYYKHSNVRPPYTYAFLIRWSILDSPEKQQTLNDIYNWFTRMFYYFRHSTPTWKNAVRHNLSLHKCFVRVDGRTGAVWTVDEEEFQKRKGQKISRDFTFKWMTPVAPSPFHMTSNESVKSDDSH